MSDILYERPVGAGGLVRVRRVSPEGTTPVRAVLEIDRRGELRAEQRPGAPPPLKEASGATDSEALSQLLEFAVEDAEVAKLMQDHGLR